MGSRRTKNAGIWTLLVLCSIAATTTAIGNGTRSAPVGSDGDRISGGVDILCSRKDWTEIHMEALLPPVCLETSGSKGASIARDQQTGSFTGVAAATTTTSGATTTRTERTAPTSSSTRDESDHELDTESPLDSARFLSFEEWKRQKLAKIGQSADNVGGGRRQASETAQERRRRPGGINNALDSLGEDSEIELDFGGFPADAPDGGRPGTWAAARSDSSAVAGQEGSADLAPTGETASQQKAIGRKKDAGTTCKERFNYASFDCAATVLKTNPESKGASSVLIENKDSYMLNECRAENKFLILELCDDILVDTVVLANYEFFSSIFRTFRVSVSDRYPAKVWKELGVFEARNTREVQAFAIENPLIWARYLKIEFLTHYGNEFYCPVSLVRVHGTTMMEEYKNEEINAIEDVVPEEEVVEEPMQAVESTESTSSTTENATVTVPTAPNWEPITPFNLFKFGYVEGLMPEEDVCSVFDASTPSASIVQPLPAELGASPGPTETGTVVHGNESVSVSSGDARQSSESGENINSSAEVEGRPTERQSAKDQETKSAPAPAKEESRAGSDTTRSTPVQPPSANPTTQESFFKSVNKRLQMLESNSSLSLRYIEEQSRILRDAFTKVERRQLAKTSTFLENLNTTVLNELRELRSQYDQVWRSVAIELEKERFEYHQELYSVTAQLGILADELVFQKRVSVIQSIFVLICLGLVLFARTSVGASLELPSVQSMMARSSTGLRSWSSSPSPPLVGTPTTSTESPNSRRRVAATSFFAKLHRRQGSDDSVAESIGSSAGDRVGAGAGAPSRLTVTVPSYAPPTPTSEGAVISPVSELGENSSAHKSAPASPLPTPEAETETRLAVPSLPDRPESSPPVLVNLRDGRPPESERMETAQTESQPLSQGPDV